MSKNTNNLPYFYSPRNNDFLDQKEKMLANFLLRKFRPRIKEKLPQHYVVQPILYKSLDFIRKTSKTHPYFLRFDVKRYYPSICHQSLTDKIPESYVKISGKPLSRRMKQHLKNILPLYLEKSPYNRGISVGSPLSYVLASLFLLDLDLEIPHPFLRQVDDYLVFCKNKKEAEKLLKEIIVPKLSELGLEINEKKLKSGKFYKDKVDFVGFNFYAGYFLIKEKKKEEFKKKITTITSLNKKKSEVAIIKLLNNQILGFGHYYKHSSCKKQYEELDAFIRMRLRRWLFKQKELDTKQGNFVLSNASLKNMGLKSLISIGCPNKYKRKTKKQKKSKITTKTGRYRRNENQTIIQELEFKYQQRELICELKKVTSLLNKLAKKISNIEKELGK